MAKIQKVSFLIMSRELSNNIRSTLVYQTVIFFTKVSHRLIKVYVKNPQKELMELSDLLVSAGSRTLFDLVLWKFLQFSLRSVIV